MTPKEMRELDEWLKRLWPQVEVDDWPDWTPTKDRCQAMEVLEKCVEQSQVTMQKPGTHWQVWNRVNHHATAETLPLAICRFARKLFEQ